jgi:hypothetical protein
MSTVEPGDHFQASPPDPPRPTDGLSIIGLGVAATAISPGIVFLIAAYSDPDPEDVAKEARKAIASHWNADPDFKKVKITQIKLDPPVHRVYVGVMEVAIAERVQRFNLRVHFRHHTVDAEWVPIVDP